MGRDGPKSKDTSFSVMVLVPLIEFIVTVERHLWVYL